MSKRVLLESPFLLCPLKVCSLPENLNQARKKSTKIKFLGPETARWGGGLPREGVVAENFVPALETLSSLGFEERNPGCPGIFAGMSRTPGGVQKVCEKKTSCAFFVPYLREQRRSGLSKNTTFLKSRQKGGLGPLFEEVALTTHARLIKGVEDFSVDVSDIFNFFRSGEGKEESDLEAAKRTE